jgi:molybdate transport system substrate-binding protein
VTASIVEVEENSGKMTAASRTRNYLVLALGLCLFLGPLTTARADEIIVSAAASLTDALQEIRGAYLAKAKHQVRFNFGPSSGLARQIDQGAPADIFFSADVAQMDNLDKTGRLESDTRRNLLSNQLVIIVPEDSKRAITSPKDLLKPEVNRIALADPAIVPVGVYTRTFLTSEGLWDKVKLKIVPLQDVRATLAAVESGNVEAGFVYKTDAVGSKKINLVYEVPVRKGPRIIYPVAMVRESKKKAAAHDFLSYLASPSAKAIFNKFGFITLD